jgi:hypothetical protein
MIENGNGEEQDALLVMLRERARQLDLDIEVLRGRRQEVLDLITSIQPDARRQEPERGGGDLLAPAQEAQEQPKR